MGVRFEFVFSLGCRNGRKTIAASKTTKKTTDHAAGCSITLVFMLDSRNALSRFLYSK
jgi:hypothetical protein